MSTADDQNTVPESPMVLGWEEWVSLPKLDILAVKAKVDTGAKTSSLHAFSIEVYGSPSKRRVRFGIHPIPDRPDIEIHTSAPMVDRREVTSSNGETELRPIIETELEIGGQRKPIEISLTNRENMAYRMLLGRQAIDETMIVNPNASHVQGELDADLYTELMRANEGPKSLRICILSREPDNYTTQRLIEEAEARDHMVDVINTTRCYMNINSERPEVHYDGKVLPAYDAVIPRIGASITFYGMAVVRQFEMMGTYVLASSQAISRSRDKLHAHQLLAERRIGMPITGFARSPQDSSELIRFVGGAPVVLKILEGTQGKGVVLAETKKAAESVIEAFRTLKANILVQQFIGEAGGEDIRLFVIGNKVVAAMKRKASDGDYRSNLHQGGKALPVKITKEERETAIKAAKVLGLRVAGVDLLRATDGPKVLEVNSSPGFEGIETVSGKNIAGLVVEHLEKNARPRHRSKASAGR